MDEKVLRQVQINRDIIKGYRWSEFAEFGDYATDESLKLPRPPLFLHREGDATVMLTKDFSELSTSCRLYELMTNRTSVRNYSEDSLSLTELSWLLYATQGVKKALSENRASFRTVPSAGARHALETYLLIHRVAGVAPGLYFYDAEYHFLHHLGNPPDENVNAAFYDQKMMSQNAVSFIWTAVAYRMEYRYGIKAARYLMLDAGHVCQNLYIAGEQLGCGVCGVAAYSQDLVDALISADGKDEFSVYCASLGRKA